MTTPLWCQSCRERTPHRLTPTGAMKCCACGQWRERPVVKVNSGKQERKTVNIIEQLGVGYDEFLTRYNHAPNAIIMGYHEKAQFIRDVLGQRMVPVDIPPQSGATMMFMGCEVIESARGGIQFAVTGDRLTDVEGFVVTG